jgi:hypothetical protein
MKPTPQISSKQRSSDKDRLTPDDIFPKTDYAYHGTAELVEPAPAVAETKSSSRRSFHTLSSDFFNKEAHREYRKEAIFFVWVACVAAWPLSVTVNQLMTMMIWSPPW